MSDRRMPAGAHTVGRVRDALALLCLGFTLRNYLVKLDLVQRTDVRTVRLSQVVRPAIFDLSPEPSAYDLLAVVYHCGGAALVATYALESVAGNGIGHPTIPRRTIALVKQVAWRRHQSESGTQAISVPYV